MSTIAVAFYARVASEQQAQSQTMASQVAALRDPITPVNEVLSPAHEFIDQGYSGSTWIRPAVERLRDAVAAGEVERVYVYSPDRLARKYAYQVILIAYSDTNRPRIPIQTGHGFRGGIGHAFRSKPATVSEVKSATLSDSNRPRFPT